MLSSVLRRSNASVLMRSSVPALGQYSGVIDRMVGSACGFIKSSDNTEVFVHVDDIKQKNCTTDDGKKGYKALERGMEVEFDLGEYNGKTKAVNVTAAGGKPLPLTRLQTRIMAKA